MQNRRTACAILFALSSIPLLCQSSPSKDAPISYWHEVITPDTLPVWTGGGPALLGQHRSRD